MSGGMYSGALAVAILNNKNVPRHPRSKKSYLHPRRKVMSAKEEPFADINISVDHHWYQQQIYQQSLRKVKMVACTVHLLPQWIDKTMNCRWGQYQFDEGNRRVGRVVDPMFPACNLGVGCATFGCKRECSNITLRVLREMIILSKPFALVVVTYSACLQNKYHTLIIPGAYQLCIFVARVYLNKQRVRLLRPSTLYGCYTLDSMNEQILSIVFDVIVF